MTPTKGSPLAAGRLMWVAIAFLDQLITEMALLAGHVHTAPVAEIAIGGGSPDFLSPSSLRTMIAALDRSFALRARDPGCFSRSRS